ncbi:MAG: recombinase family protein [Acidobacteriota bacterium]
MIAAIYARKSTEQSGVADEQKSVTRQIEHARAYATRKGWIVADEYVYIDDGISGAEFTNRPGFIRLMNALRPRPGFQVLVMSEESRLGREAIETAYALKQLVSAGVRVFFYLEDRERTLNSPIEKAMLSLQTMADEMEREKARQRTYDAMQRKARAGHVTGGACFGYRAIEIVGTDGRRSHVERELDPTAADVIRRIFRLSAEGHGIKAIAKQLNAAGAPSPRAQGGRSNSWAPSSVREVLFRPLYRGEIVWNRTRKRDSWGRKHQTDRPVADWIRLPAPALRIVSDDEWAAAHARIDGARRLYLKGTAGQAFGRPALGNPSKYLLTNLALCGCCGGPLRVRTRRHGVGRKHFYGCGGYHERGRTVCANAADVPMTDADDIVLEALLDDVLTPDVLEDAVDEALQLLQDDQAGERVTQIDRALATVQQQRARLVEAIATGGQLSGLLEALSTRETRAGQLEAERATLCAQRPVSAGEAGRVRDGLLALAGSWRRVLAEDPTHARPIVSSLLIGRVTFTPMPQTKRWELRGQGTLAGLFVGEIFPSVWRPQRDSQH